MLKLFIFASFLVVSNAYLNHEPPILNHPNYGLYHGGYSVKDHVIGPHQANYLAPHGFVPAYAKATLPIPSPLPTPTPVPVPATVPVIQKLGHTGYAYAPVSNFPISHAPIALPEIQPKTYAPAHYAGAQTNYVIAPSVSFSQNVPKQIAPVVPISKVIRIPYAYSTINEPHPIPQPISDPVLGW